MSLENELAALFHTAHGKAFDCYLRKGHVPPDLTRIMAITREWLDDCQKKNPRWHEQPRVPAGNPDGGQWTDGGGNGGRREPEGRVIDDPPLEPVYPEALILSLLPAGRLLEAWRRFVRNGRRSADWKLGAFKSPARWQNQVKKRNWTPDEITHTIKTGKKFPAPNKVNPGNRAVRYQDSKTGRYVVRDEITKEILQISGENFDPEKPAK